MAPHAALLHVSCIGTEGGSPNPSMTRFMALVSCRRCSSLVICIVPLDQQAEASCSGSTVNRGRCGGE